MTNENKEKILDYLVGDYQTTSPSNEEIFLEQEAIDKEEWLPYLPTHWNNFRFQGMIAPNEQTTSLGVMYGGYIDNNNAYGIIVLVDQNFKPVKTIYEYDSGTKLRFIQYMKQAEDGTFYFIDDTVFSPSQRQQVVTSQKRFVMVNNFTLESNGDFSLRLRTSYILSGNYVNFYCKNMYKDPNSSHYIFFGAGADTSSPNYPYRQLKIWSLKINVGSSNEWTMYANDNDKIFGSAIATFEEENVRYRCLATNNLINRNEIMLYSKTYTGSATSSAIITFDDYKPYIDDENYKKQSVFLDYDNVYFVQNNQNWGNTGVIRPKYIGLYRYNIATSNLKTIYNKYLGDYDYCNIEAIYIDRCNTDIYVQYNTNVNRNDPVETRADYYFQRLVNDLWNPIKIAEQEYYRYNYRTLYIKANYNLLQVYLYATNPRIATAFYYYRILEDYNVLNYNSNEYNDYNSMIGTKGEIYSNGNLVFARNLYNRTQWNNTTTSTIQIPNSYLNGITLQPKNLLSYSNNTINSDTTELTKNVYESVLLNFINTIDVVDEETQTNYPNDASYINTNINVGNETNYNNTKITKARINYESGSKIIPITWNDISTDTTIAKQTTFSIYVSSALTSIDFISEDETFIYITKEYEGLQVGNYYTITQKIRIE